MPAIKKKGRKRRIRTRKQKKKTSHVSTLQHLGTHYHPHHKGGSISRKKKEQKSRKGRKRVKLVRLPHYNHWV